MLTLIIVKTLAIIGMIFLSDFEEKAIIPVATETNKHNIVKKIQVPVNFSSVAVLIRSNKSINTPLKTLVAKKT